VQHKCKCFFSGIRKFNVSYSKIHHKVCWAIPLTKIFQADALKSKIGYADYVLRPVILKKRFKTVSKRLVQTFVWFKIFRIKCYVWELGFWRQIIKRVYPLACRTVTNNVRYILCPTLHFLSVSSKHLETINFVQLTVTWPNKFCCPLVYIIYSNSFQLKIKKDTFFMNNVNVDRWVRERLHKKLRKLVDSHK